MVVSKGRNCRKTMLGLLCHLPCDIQTNLATALCNIFQNVEINCDDFKPCETLTTLSEFTVDGNQICITYKDEQGEETQRCFNLETSEVTITADNGLSKDTPTNVQLGGPEDNPSPLLHNTSIDLNGQVFKILDAPLGQNNFVIDNPNFQAAFSVSNGSAGSAINLDGTSSSANFAISADNGTGGNVFISGNATARTITFRDPGGFILSDYGIGSFVDTPAYILGVDSVGNVIETTSNIVITADNGLTKDTPTNVQLGNAVAGAAPLLHDTYIDPNGFFTLWENVAVIDDSGVVGIGNYSSFNSTRLDIVDNGLGVLGLMSNFSSTSTNAGILVNVTGVGSMSGILVSTVNQVGVTSNTTNSTAIVGNSTAGSGVSATSVSSYAGTYTVTPSSTNTVVPVILLNRATSGTAANGIGVSLELAAQCITGGSTTSNQIKSRWTDAIAASRTSEFSITGVNNTAIQTLLTISGAGIFTLTQGLQDFADDTAAATGLIPVNGLYRTASVVKMRVT